MPQNAHSLLSLQFVECCELMLIYEISNHYNNKVDDDNNNREHTLNAGV